MPRRIAPDGAKLEIYKPANEPSDPATPDADRTPDIHIGPETGTTADIGEVTVPRTLGPLKDQASFTLDNHDGQYRRGDRQITSGDEVVWSVRFEDDPDTWHERFRGVVLEPTATELASGGSILSFTCEDFVGAVLSWRYLEAGYQDRRIAGSEAAILEHTLARKCPEIARNQITADDSTTTYRANATQMLTVVKELAALTDGIVWSDARSLVLESLTGVSASWALTGSDYEGLAFEIDDSELANAIRIDGGSSQASLDTQEDQTEWTTVTEAARIEQQLHVPKSEVSMIEVWTDPTRIGSGDGVVVRLQKDDGGAPIDPSDTSLDLARRTYANEFLEHDGFTAFDMPDNDVVNDDPWLLIEGDGEGDSSGQAIGTNTVGTPAYRAYYPFPISGRKEDGDAIAEYRRREKQLTDSSITSLQALGQQLSVQLDRENTRTETLTFAAVSDRAHALTPGDAIAVDNARVGAMGEYVVTKREDTVAETVLTTTIEAVELETL